MNQETKIESWNKYSSIFKNVLKIILQLADKRAEKYVNGLRIRMELSFSDPDYDPYGFFFDPPLRHLYRLILGRGLRSRIYRINSIDAIPIVIFNRLADAIECHEHWETLLEPTFDWDKARDRYKNEMRKIDDLLTELETGQEEHV